MKIEDGVRHRHVRAFGVGKVIEISALGTVRVDFGRSGKLWLPEAALEPTNMSQDGTNALPSGPESASRQPPRLDLEVNVQEGWLVEHNEFGWGEVLAVEAQNVLIAFMIGEKAMDHGGLRGHLLDYDAHPAADDPRRVPHREWPTGGGWTPGPKWASYRFGTPNTRRWHKF